jgi:hypothetical protein
MGRLLPNDFGAQHAPLQHYVLLSLYKQVVVDVAVVVVEAVEKRGKKRKKALNRPSAAAQPKQQSTCPCGDITQQQQQQQITHLNLCYLSIYWATTCSNAQNFKREMDHCRRRSHTLLFIHITINFHSPSTSLPQGQRVARRILY